MAGEIKGVILDDGTHKIDYQELANLPSIPSSTSDLDNDSGFVTDTQFATTTVAGVVKVGAGLTIADGVLSVAMTDANEVSY